MKRQRVIASTHTRFASSRELIRGIFNRIDKGLDWEFDFALSADALRNQIAAAERGEGPDGFIIAYFLDDEIIERLIKLDKPIVTVGVHDDRLRRRRARTVEIRNDGLAIGQVAADYINRLGKFASRAFVHLHVGREFGHSDERLAGVGASDVFESPFDEGSDEDYAALGRFLLGLPKPAAVVAAHDKRALDVLRTARKSGIKVPKELAVIGVDNDELFCTHCDPPLTSVHPGHFGMGYAAADELNKAFRSRLPGNATAVIKVPPIGIVERESTRTIPSGEVLVQRAREFISANACKGIGPSDVVASLRCSRALLYLRFREKTGSTLRQAIEDARLKEVKRLLKTTGRSLKAIASQCGFSSECRLSHLFVQRFGCPPSVWRQNANCTRPAVTWPRSGCARPPPRPSGR